MNEQWTLSEDNNYYENNGAYLSYRNLLDESDQEAIKENFFLRLTALYPNLNFNSSFQSVLGEEIQQKIDQILSSIKKGFLYLPKDNEGVKFFLASDPNIETVFNKIKNNNPDSIDTLITLNRRVFDSMLEKTP